MQITECTISYTRSWEK